jgi:hypothetical protein
VSRAWTWEQLAAATLKRQFPKVRGRGEKAVVDLVTRVGNRPSQVARSPFVTIASRLPAHPEDAITAAYESYAIVRGSNLRGTVQHLRGRAAPVARHDHPPDHGQRLAQPPRAGAQHPGRRTGGNREVRDRGVADAPRSCVHTWSTG